MPRISADASNTFPVCVYCDWEHSDPENPLPDRSALLLWVPGYSEYARPDLCFRHAGILLLTGNRDEFWHAQMLVFPKGRHRRARIFARTKEMM